MGLGAVELVMEIEETFNIELPSHEAEQIETVGDLHRAILAHMGEHADDADRCLTAATFYELRRTLESQLGIRESLRPKSRLDDLLPRRGRRKLWRKISREMDLRFPSLERPTWLVVLCSLGVATVTIATYLSNPLANESSVSIFLASLALAFSTAAAVTITRPFAKEMGESFQTLRGLVQKLLAMNYAKLAARYQSSSPTDVWNVLRCIVAEQLGIDKEQVKPEAHFVYDLGLD